jgi:hypothetical protein
MSFNFSTKMRYKFCSFCTTRTEQNEAKKLFVLKKAKFSVLIPLTTHLKWILNKNVQKLLRYLTIFYRKYWEFTVLYSILEFLTECRSNNQYWTIFFVKYWSISFVLTTRNFDLVNHHQFHTIVCKFNFYLSKFDFQFKTANFEYHSYLLVISLLFIIICGYPQ